MDPSFLPSVNAALNAIAAVLLVRGRQLARRRDIDAHRRIMLGAFAVSTLFLVLYLAHKAARSFENTPFHGEGLARLAYLVLLATHVTLAMTVPFLAITLIALGLRGPARQPPQAGTGGLADLDVRLGDRGDDLCGALSPRSAALLSLRRAIRVDAEARTFLSVDGTMRPIRRARNTPSLP